ncbi:MAG: hypothetical protein HYW79_02095 [Parcubacteria group bacterium]|nr:hypothetical protein [Parcubacteria group bacterium]
MEKQRSIQKESEAEMSRPENKISRREFLKTAGASFAAAILAGNAKEALALIEKTSETKEKEDGEPKISFDIFYSFHDTAKDAEGLAERIKKSDIYMPELFGWNERYLNDTKAIAEGKMTPDELMWKRLRGFDQEYPYSFDYAEAKALYKSSKYVAYVDVPREHPLFDKGADAREELGRIDLTKNFSELAVSFNESVRRWADVQKEREVYILSELGRFADSIKDGRMPKLKGKKEIKILIALGAMHTGVYHELSRTEKETSRKFHTMPLIFGKFASELARRFMFGKDTDETLATQALFGAVFSSMVSNRSDRSIRGSYEVSLIERKIVPQFSIDEMKKIFAEARIAEDPQKKFLDASLEKLKEKGIRLPSSEKELDTFLNG